MASFLSYNIADGSNEAWIHGLARGLLRGDDYGNLTQCDTLEDMKIHLSATDYGPFLANEANLSSKIITDRAMEKLVDDFTHLRNSSSGICGEFLDFITYEYQITNVLKLINGAKNGRGSLEMMYKCHPLGIFEGMAALNSVTTMDDVYEIVLIDSPLGRFFQYTDKQDFSENSLEYMRAMLQKNWIEQYNELIQKIGGETEECMSKVLEFEADRLVITLTRNTYGSKDFHRDERLALFPSIGKLVDIHETLANCEDDDALKDRLRPYPEYADLLADAAPGGDTEGGSLETKFMEMGVGLHKDNLSRQFQYGCFFSYFKLRELEVNNLMWIAECITQQMKNRVNEYVPIY